MHRAITQEQATARNEFNALLNEVEGHLTRLVSEWQGLKVWKTSGRGGAVAKLNKQLEAYCESHGYNQRTMDTASVWLNWTCSYGPSGTLTLFVRNLPLKLSADLLIGWIDEDGILTKTYDCVQRRTDYTADAVNEAHKQADALEEQARELRASVRDFAR